MDLLEFLKTKINLTSDELNTIDSLFHYEEYPKGTIFLKTDNFSKRVIFLEKGLYRTFYYNESKDITHHFWDENSFNAPLESIIDDEVSLYGWQAIEVCTIRYIDCKDLHRLIIENKEFYNLILAYILELNTLFSHRVYALHFRTAEEKYDFFMDKYPNIINRIPLGYLASYIGITQQTLSILRGKK
jgi:hypothetical protein